jgi:long-subunit acyl-CoA synthetase (AMP-forming)/N-acetylglutamate synthase-like GNAT family acetyltransferase
VQDLLGSLEKSGGAETGLSDAARVAGLFRSTREAVAALESAKSDASESAAGRVHATRSLVHRILEAASTRAVRLAFHTSPFATEWTDLLLEAVQLSDYTVGKMFFARAHQLGDHSLFLLPSRYRQDRVTWHDAGARVMAIGRALLALEKSERIAPVAMLSANSPGLALFDLACLSVGIRNVPVPTNSPTPQIDFILEHSKARSLFVGDAILAEVAREALGKRDGLRVHWLDPDREADGSIRTFAEFLAAGDSVSEDQVTEAVAAVRSSDVATTMYTSGTTGIPKGVPFTNGNLMTKRFARAAAWPDVGEGDRFLCYLPLYHTFGRWLEMLGCVFWGAVYAFVEDVSKEGLLESFKLMRPTTFISVPKKWIDVAEHVAPLEGESPPEAARSLAKRLHEETGGYLKRGLSAAGYLPAAVFRRFHDAGVALHSGFGMTEATGGITMTPVGDYRDDSIGVALPGIELQIADDGELLVRGPYVTPPTEDDPPRAEGWLATGDIVQQDDEGHLRIVDRKKEIFKNVQGETISPRRIESLFEDFDVVDRALVIGDRRDFCTVLLVPSSDLREQYAADTGGPTLESPELWELFLPVVATVNRFLAPYERILDFAILARDLDAERGELTAKGTPKRALVAERYNEIIEPMYSREELTRQVGDLAVTLPQWFLRHAGISAGDVHASDDGLRIVTTGIQLTIRREPRGAGVRVGDLVYDLGDHADEVWLGEILGRAQLWLGNEAVRRFGGPGIVHWWRRGRRSRVGTSLRERPLGKESATSAWSETSSGEGLAPPLDLEGLHERARALLHPLPEVRRAAVESCGRRLANAPSEVQSFAREVLYSVLDDREVRSAALIALLPSLSPTDLESLFAERLDDDDFLSESEANVVARQALRGDQLASLLERTTVLAAADHRGLGRLLGYLVRQAVEHAQSHLQVRSFLVGLREEHPDAFHEELLDRCLEDLASGLRARAPALETAPGVSWEEAVELHGVTDSGERARILDALANTKLLPEAIALLGASPARRILPLEPKCVRVTFLGTGNGRAIHLLEWSPTGLDGAAPAFECLLKVNRDLDWDDVRREVRLLIRARTGGSGRPVVKTQGGGYPEQGIWTEEWVPGRTLDAAIESLIVADGTSLEAVTARGRWQFVVSTCTSLIVDFWKRTGQKVSLAHATPEKIVVPRHDWQVGGRLVSVAERVPCGTLSEVLEAIDEGLVRPLRARFPDSDLGPSWPYLLSSALEVLGETEGFRRLEEETGDERASRPIRDAIQRFLSSAHRRGFLPLRIRNAVRRYRTWSQLNPRATLEAQAATLDQIQDAYALEDLDRERPGSIAQFYRHTVFRGSSSEFRKRFDEMIAGHRAEPHTTAEWHREVADLRESWELSGHEEFWLARMLYPHVDPAGRAFLVREEDPGGGFQTGIQVEYEDQQGERFSVRRPTNPNEIAALVRVFAAANFRRVPITKHHDFLVVTDATGRVAGGLIFRRMSDAYVRLHGLVVSRHRRGRGIGKALLTDLLQRLRVQGVQAVSTGFFRPAFYSAFGFGVDPRYAGLVRFLSDDAADRVGSETTERGR